MKIYSFRNDYSEGCHPSILQAMTESNLDQHTGYGDDEISVKAKDLIRSKINSPDSDVYLVSGGTQANLVLIAAALRPHECVISASTGHVNVHETGAIEATGHRIESIETLDGKIVPDDIRAVVEKFGNDIHMVKPRLVYISNSTEIGTIYYRAELMALSAICKENDLLLYMDGARLGSALCAETNDISLPDLAKFTDAFYIGGTKNGALLGEAIVINNPVLKTDFLYSMKQRGALLAKGRLLGVQFLGLFTNNLFFDLASHANRLAAKLVMAFKNEGYNFLTESYTNQIFPVLPVSLIEKLEGHFEFYIWQRLDEQFAAIRLVTSWATKEEAVDRLIAEVKEYKNAL